MVFEESKKDLLSNLKKSLQVGFIVTLAFFVNGSSTALEHMPPCKQNIIRSWDQIPPDAGLFLFFFLSFSYLSPSWPMS